MAKTVQEKIIIGLKIRQYRQEAGWSFDELSKRTGISVSYLNEIEKGKKSPQAANLAKIAQAFQVSVAELSSSRFGNQLAPIGALIESHFLEELPLELFGISTQQVVDIMAKAPERVNAFISAMLEIARNYSVRQENFFLAALRAYQEMRMNYFEEIEAEAHKFNTIHQLMHAGSATSERLEEILADDYQIKLDEHTLGHSKELKHLRSVFLPKKKTILLQDHLSEAQRSFQLAKELGFQVLKLKERPLASSLIKVKSFDQVLNNYLAAYFAVAVLVPERSFVEDVKKLFHQPTWQPETLLSLLAKYQIGPEVFFQRFNVLSRDFGLHKVFFLRIIHHIGSESFEIDKELHLNRRHTPHSNGQSEFYCRRWIGIRLLNQLKDSASEQKMIAGAQRMRFSGSKEEYLCLSVAKPGHPTPGRQVSIMIGIEIDDASKKTIAWWNDKSIATAEVGITCARCPIQDCAERMSPPSLLERSAERRKVEEALKKLTD